MGLSAEEAFHHLLGESVRRVEEAAARLREMGPGETVSAGAWSRAQVLGHLWDSAQVNHLRVLRALERDDLSLPGYNQDDWVRQQAPSEMPWPLLVDGWRADNLRLLHLAGRLEARERRRPRLPHSLSRIAWQPFRAEVPASLEDLLRDYLGHLWHHLGRIHLSLVPPMAPLPGLGAANLPLEGPRVRLRKFRPDDVECVAAMLADEAVVRHLPGPPRTLEQSRRTVAFFVEQDLRDGFSAWALTLKGEDRCLGWCGLADFDSTGEVEVLYCLEQAAWGRGLASEAAALCVACARDRLGLPSLVAAVDPPNIASRRVLEKCAFRPWRQGRHFGMLLDLHRLDFSPTTF